MKYGIEVTDFDHRRSDNGRQGEGDNTGHRSGQKIKRDGAFGGLMISGFSPRD
ncbi:MAG: hypothetical protein IPI60_02835 [Saprospiraceae bacterium]|nr:hypothetical protein [Saprospiraceae bacterium]